MTVFRRPKRDFILLRSGRDEIRELLEVLIGCLQKFQDPGSAETLKIAKLWIELLRGASNARPPEASSASPEAIKNET